MLVTGTVGSVYAVWKKEHPSGGGGVRGITYVIGERYS
jgi:hypothetical protein